MAQSISQRLMRRPDRGQLMEVMLARIYGEIVRPGDWVIDGGAYGGMHTLPLARLVSPGGRVVAYEPTVAIDDLAAWLDNEGLRDAVTLRRMALSDSAGPRDFYVHKANPALSSLAIPDAPHDFDRITVAATRLDDEAIAGRLTFIKLDLEGGEYPCLRGAPELLAGHSPTIVFENGRAWPATQFGYTKEDFFALFRRHRYRLTDIFGRRFEEESWLDDEVAWYFVARRAAAPALGLAAMARRLLSELEAQRFVFAGWEDVVSSVLDGGRLPASPWKGGVAT